MLALRTSWATAFDHRDIADAALRAAMDGAPVWLVQLGRCKSVRWNGCPCSCLGMGRKSVPPGGGRGLLPPEMPFERAVPSPAALRLARGLAEGESWNRSAHSLRRRYWSSTSMKMMRAAPSRDP